MKKDWKREYFSIPNIMGYFRIILVFVYMSFFYNSLQGGPYWPVIATIIVSGLTDFFDGKVARRFDMITDWGKILDPIADKLTQGIVVISLIFRYRFMAIVLVIFIVQQLGQGILGLIYIKKSGKVEGAKMFGKVSTAFLDFMVLVLVIWIDIPKNVALAMMTVSVFLMTNSLLRYFDYYYKEIRK